MSNKLSYSFTNPLQFFSSNADRDDRYNGKDFEDFDFTDTILPWQQATSFSQPWQKNDTIALQLQSNIGPVNFILKRWCDDVVIDTVQLDQKQQSINEPGVFIYELSAPLSDYDEGEYYAELQLGIPIVFSFRSGKLSIKELQENTLLLEAKHFESREDLIFETGFFPSVRVPATKRYMGPKSKATAYVDQFYNATTLRNVKYREWNLLIGGSIGIPDYFIDMLGGWLGCSDFRIDGKKYTKKDGAEFEINGLQNYPMRGWAITLNETLARGGRIYENDDPINVELTAMINVDSKGFGNSNTGSQTAIIDIE